jgi:hypothetical protein
VYHPRRLAFDAATFVVILLVTLALLFMGTAHAAPSSSHRHRAHMHHLHVLHMRHMQRKHPRVRWYIATASVYGGCSEAQSVAGPYKGTRWLEAHGILYFAHKTMRFGRRVTFRYRGRTVTAICVDRGPYCGGRTFDLGINTARALGFPGVARLSWK